MKSHEIRTKYLEFFKSKGHTIVESDSLAPKNDPTLLFTGAGMNQFKEQFMGKNVTYKRATSSQKCMRTGDLENVGRTTSHHTFFEMLGNFSFGDYFKKEACEWAWEFMTVVMKIPAEKLWVSIYKDDEEALNIWKNIVKVPAERIVKMGAKDNFWPSNAPTLGPNGPCGPCSEIYYDWGKDMGCKKPGCNPECDCGRFIEVWNLVFTQFNRLDVNKLEPLPSKNIDTGMGLERITRVMQGAKNNFETDLFVPITDEIKKINKDLKTFAVNAIADHVRASVFAIADGVSPSNEDRGYVIRKLIRRAYLLSKANKTFLFTLVPTVVRIMECAYPYLSDRRQNIALVIKEEEEKFQHTLTLALPKLEEAIGEYKDHKVIPGSAIFKLVDTYGLPLDLIEAKTADSGHAMDIEGFEKLMEEQKELSRRGSKIESNIFVEGVFSKAPAPKEENQDPLKAKIVFIAREKEILNAAGEGEHVLIMTEPQSAAFYTEMGGQVGDTGVITCGNAQIRIINTVRNDARIVHDTKVVKGSIRLGDEATVILDGKRKGHIAMNHTATHLLHSALRKVLGAHVKQSGSLVDEKRFRFDFTHLKKMSDLEIEWVENYVNDRIKEKAEVKKEIKARAEAEKEGAMALFGEKYGNEVRVVTIEGYSKEFCAGTHVDNTGDIEFFKILSESSIASGIRRIEGVTSDGVRAWIRDDAAALVSKYIALKNEVKTDEEAKALDRKVSGALIELENIHNGVIETTLDTIRNYTKALKPEIMDAIEVLGRLKKKLDKEKTQGGLAGLDHKADELIGKSETLSGVNIVSSVVDAMDMNALRTLTDKIKMRAKSVCVALVSVNGSQASLVVGLTPDMNDKGLDAQTIVKEAAKVMNGSGGGRKDFAQAGGKDAAKAKDALEAAKKIFFNALKS